MTKTKADVVAMSLRRLGVLASDTTPSAAEDAFAGDVLDGLIADLKATHGMAAGFDVTATPDAAYLPLAYLLATELGPHYAVQTEPRATAMGRLRAYMHTDDRATAADYDEDGTVTTAEQAAYDRAAWY